LASENFLKNEQCILIDWFLFLEVKEKHFQINALKISVARAPDFVWMSNFFRRQISEALKEKDIDEKITIF